MKLELMTGLAIGVIVTSLVIVLAAYLTITNGLIPAGMDSGPIPIEKWAAHHDLNAVLKREAMDTCPLQADEANLLAGHKLYASDCSGCHGTPSDPKPAFGAGFYPIPTPFAKHSVTDDPEAETYWKIKHGIKWTGMPSFKNQLSDKEMWQVVLFLKHMDELPPKVQEAWKSTH